MPPRTIFHISSHYILLSCVRSIIFNFLYMFINTFMTEKFIILNEISIPASILFLKYS